MKRNNNKFFVLLITLVFITTFLSQTNAIKISKNNELPIDISVFQTDESIKINYKINSFTKIPVDINEKEYSKITIAKESNILIKGLPDIPNICRSVLIPDDSNMIINVLSSSYDEYNNILIAPSKGDLPRTINPEDISYEFGDIYNVDAWYPEDLTSLREPYILRDFRGQVVEIYPIQYNPVKKQMRVYTDIQIELVADGPGMKNCIFRENLPLKIDSNFKSIYKNHFINFGKTGRYDPVSEQGNMLVIVYDDFWDTMVPFVEWKNLKGIPTEMFNVSEIGDSNAIKTFIADYYNDYGLAFVLLAGDAQQVPTLYTSPYTSGASDPSYSFIVGTDNYQDLFIGRFSAQNTADLQTQVERSIEYEKYPQLGVEWYHKGIGVASNLGPGDDGEYDDEHMDNIRDDLLAYTYTEVDQSYDPYGSSTMIADALNEGRSIANYCGHGGPTGWSNGGGFGNSNVNSLVNDNMLPFVCCVACNNGQFDDYEPCFAEAWLRATNNGEPTGGIGCFASTQSQSWNPPMDAQDEMIDILVETYPDNLKTTYGALCFEGTMHMMDEYGSSCYDETDSWTVFGDPSLQVRTNIPIEMTVNHNANIDISTLSLEVEVAGVEGALCALSRNNELFGSAYTNEEGIALITLKDPPTGDDPLDLVVTGYNKIPYYAEIMLNAAPEIPDKPEGPPNGGMNKEYTFSTNTIDADGDQVYYMWRWGDGVYTDWLGPFDSGETTSASHSWQKTGNFKIRVKAKDTNDQETEWSDELIFNVEKSKTINSPFVFILERLFGKFPHSFPILRHLI